MSMHPGTVTVWQSGRLAPRATARRFEFTGEHWLIAGLALMSLVVMAIYVAVLEKDVDRTAMARLEQRSRAVAEARCESDRAADQRGRCIALFDGDAAAVEAPAMTVSLAGER